MPEPVMAKGTPHWETLEEHTVNCLQVLKMLKQLYPDIPDDVGVPNFFIDMFYSLFFHDFGKAASGFQKQLKDGIRWNYRHEVLSACFIPLLDLPGDILKTVALGIITHHKSVDYLRNYNPKWDGGLWKEKLKEVEPNLSYLKNLTQKIPELSKEIIGIELPVCKFPDNIDELENSYVFCVKPFRKAMRKKQENLLTGKYALILKGFINACDHLASSGITNIHRFPENIRKKFSFNKLNTIQEISSNTTGNTILTAPTGSGKTESSLLWSQKNQNDSGGRRVFYVLPYTASINAMFERFLNIFEENQISVQHGKSSLYLYNFFNKISNDYTFSTLKAKEKANLARKIYTSVNILTPFQILKSFFGVKGFEMQLAKMNRGLFIFDEIHAYDPHTTALILETINQLKKVYNAEFFIMTATLPSFLRNMISEILSGANEIRMPDNEMKVFTRHRVEVLDGGIRDCLNQIKIELEKGKKVLVIANTVKTAQEIYRKLRDYSDDPALIHSRFMQRDRNRIESKADNRQLLVSTQVVEVSLDIDYDMLFSEPAPLDALIQRMGRVNRKRRKGICPIYITREGSEADKYIYSTDIVLKTLDVLERESILDEIKLQRMIDHVYGSGYGEEDLKKYKTALDLYKSCISGLYPFMEYPDKEEDFYQMVKSVNVIPISFRDEFKSEIEAGRIFEALKFYLTISPGMFFALKKKEGVIRDEKSKDIFVNRVYEEELGLLTDEMESNMI